MSSGKYTLIKDKNESAGIAIESCEVDGDSLSFSVVAKTPTRQSGELFNIGMEWNLYKDRGVIINYANKKWSDLIWVQKNSTASGLILSKDSIKLAVEGWNKLNPMWPIRKDEFTEEISFANLVDAFNVCIAEPNMTLLLSELGWFSTVANLRDIKKSRYGDRVDSTKVFKDRGATNVKDMLGWNSGYIKIVKASGAPEKLAFSGLKLVECGYTLHFVEEFLEKYRTSNAMNSKDSYRGNPFDSAVEIYDKYDSTNIIQNRILSSFKDKDPTDYLTMLKDYLRMAKDLEITLKGDKIPKGGEVMGNVEKQSKMKLVHDNISREYSLQKNKILNEKFGKVNDAYRPHVEMEIEIDEKHKYKFLLPSVASDLESEGRDLGHCVGTYTTSVSEDRTLIVLMRDAAKISKSMLTVEIREHCRIVQIQGYQRRSPDSIEQQAIDQWIGRMKTAGLKLGNFEKLPKPSPKA